MMSEEIPPLNIFNTSVTPVACQGAEGARVLVSMAEAWLEIAKTAAIMAAPANPKSFCRVLIKVLSFERLPTLLTFAPYGRHCKSASSTQFFRDGRQPDVLYKHINRRCKV